MYTPQCRKCDYDLTGMPDEGHCPECGHAYSVKGRVGVRLPESPTEKGQRLYVQTRTITLTVIGTILIAVALYFKIAQQTDIVLYTAGFIGAVLLLCAVLSYFSGKYD